MSEIIGLWLIVASLRDCKFRDFLLQYQKPSSAFSAERNAVQGAIMTEPEEHRAHKRHQHPQSRQQHSFSWRRQHVITVEISGSQPIPKVQRALTSKQKELEEYPRKWQGKVGCLINEADQGLNILAAWLERPCFLLRSNGLERGIKREGERLTGKTQG